MSKYKIKISYMTGNSFGCEEVESYIDDDLVWSNIETVKKNVQAIREHDDMIGRIENRHTSVNMNDYKDKPWFAYEKYLGMDYYPIKLFLDNGNYMQIDAFWNSGYFESLTGVMVEDTELSNISFKKI